MEGEMSALTFGKRIVVCRCDPSWGFEALGGRWRFGEREGEYISVPLAERFVCARASSRSCCEGRMGAPNQFSRPWTARPGHGADGRQTEGYGGQGRGRAPMADRALRGLCGERVAIGLGCKDLHCHSKGGLHCIERATSKELVLGSVSRMASLRGRWNTAHIPASPGKHSSRCPAY